ncbi:MULTISPECIES: hypothetical protein [unclassified Acidisoma]|jgi:hypothetical protein|uniref:hypothetical protein n=1 Tax=unclassified Acidisoma TaxID=2634065 RepID=UPI00131C7C0D|nr:MULTISPECIES: hypothetical protein [unclassified Acidisoma]
MSQKRTAHAPQPPLLLASIVRVEGELACAEGDDLDKNPYRADSDLHEQWRIGWLTIWARPTDAP